MNKRKRTFGALVCAPIAGFILVLGALHLSSSSNNQRVETENTLATQPLLPGTDGEPLIAFASPATLSPASPDTVNDGGTPLLVEVATTPPAPTTSSSTIATTTAEETATSDTSTSVATTAPTTQVENTATDSQPSVSAAAAAATESTTAAKPPASTTPSTSPPVSESPATTVQPTTTVKPQPTTTVKPTTTAKAVTEQKQTPAPQTNEPAPAASPQRNGSTLEAIRNNDPSFSRFANVPSDQLPLNKLLAPSDKNDNGGHPDGNFRVVCDYSHLAYDDPIVFPGQPGKSHLHMFFGNTAVNAHTTTDSLVNSGGGSCQGFEANRSGYWTPAVLDGKGNAVIPDRIIVYYKSKQEGSVAALPQGLKMVVGNVKNDSFQVSHHLGWSCGGSGDSYNKSNRIPNNCGGDPVNFYIQFPQCWDGKNLDSSDHRSHMKMIDEENSCPSSHPVRFPQITILAYFPPGNTNGWHLSSDRAGGFNAGPGATLHADWFGGWNHQAMDLWMNGCMKASRNCSFGQTGTAKRFAGLNNGSGYKGPNFLSLP